MNDLTKLPVLSRDTLALLTAPQVARGDRLRLFKEFARWSLIPFALFVLPILLWSVWENQVFHAILFTCILFGFGGLFTLVYFLIVEIEDDDTRMEQWTLNIQTVRLYVQESAPDIENLTLYNLKGRNNTVNAGNTTNTQNVIGADALDALNRQYNVAKVILELLAEAKERTPKPFAYERVNAELKARGASTVETPVWQGALELLEGKVLQYGAAKQNWKQLKRGNDAEIALEDAMRAQGLTSYTENGQTTWSAAT